MNKTRIYCPECNTEISLEVHYIPENEEITSCVVCGSSNIEIDEESHETF